MLLLIWADEKYNTQKNPCVVFPTQKNPGVRPKKIPRTPPVIKIYEWGPWEPIPARRSVSATCEAHLLCQILWVTKLEFKVIYIPLVWNRANQKTLYVLETNQAKYFWQKRKIKKLILNKIRFISEYKYPHNVGPYGRLSANGRLSCRQSVIFFAFCR